MNTFKLNTIKRTLVAACMLGMIHGATASKSEAVSLKILGDAALINTLGLTIGTMKFGGGADLGFKLGKVVTFTLGGHYTALGGAAAVNYVRAPIGFDVYLAKWLYIKAGGYFSFLLSGNPGGYATTDYGMSFGSGLDIPLGKVGLIIEGTYNIGLANVTGTNKWNFSNMSVGLRFGGGGSK